MSILLYAAIVVSLLAIFFSFLKRTEVRLYPRGNKKMAELSDLIHHGALAFLRAEYKLLAIFIIVVAIFSMVMVAPRSIPNSLRKRCATL